ncbi:MAG: ABC transporter ATP-binding protein [Treponema sp.]|nr:ABC transporter ATP-binding protein [Treponema sp.]
MLKTILNLPGKILRLLDRRRKFYLIVLFFLTILLSAVETIGISIIMPFISVASNPTVIDSGRYKLIYDFFHFASKNRFIISFGGAIIIFYLFRSIYNVFYNYIINKFSLGTFRYFSSRVFKTYMTMPYKLFVQKNSATLTNMVNTEASNLSTVLMNLLKVCSELITVLFFYGALLFVNWKMTLLLSLILVASILFIFFTLIRKTKRLGEKRYTANVKVIHILWETFGNFKFVKLKGNEDKILDAFTNSTSKLSYFSIIANTLGAVPRNILENLGFSLLIGSVCYILWRYNSPARIIPIVSMFALAMYRMLPAINRSMEYTNNIAFLQHSVEKIHEELKIETEQEGSDLVSFTSTIRVDALWFRYLKGGDVIKDISLEIQKGEKVAITGESGSGKTTLVDLIIGIYRPMEGRLYVDDVLIDSSNIRSWRSKIGYIPQNIYLFDGTVAANVAFGSEPNEKRIIRVLKKAKVWNFLETKEGINTVVGEGGIQLSGGQKQRIGIARALYNDPEVLVLDEATSSLDDATEAEIMDEIYDVSGDKTLIIIAHRLSTVERCDRRIRIANGTLTPLRE